MHVDVRDILAESVGYRRAYKIMGERPELEQVKLTKDIEGEITISRLELGLLVQGRLTSEIELVCDRCLRTFARPTQFHFQQLFAREPADDEMPIEDGLIDLAPLAEQEILLSLPIKILHAPDCPGIEDAAEKYTKEDIGTRLKDQARIKKGTQRGRT
ncbi:MAG TPA: DUF177 domain-containing protein [Candidatus Saccharimonadia bacterium]|jgi:uncharacterized metal-binding protein YceD (DUF177 family)